MIGRARRWAAVVVASLTCCGCGGYSLRVALEGPEGASAEPDESAPPPAPDEVREPEPHAIPEGTAPSAHDAEALAERVERLYREWRRAGAWTVRALRRGLDSPSVVSEEVLGVRDALMKLRPHVGPRPGQVLEEVAEEYSRLAREYVPGGGHTLAHALETLERKANRALRGID